MFYWVEATQFLDPLDKLADTVLQVWDKPIHRQDKDKRTHDSAH
jgi:hypothetical protein